MARIRPIVVSAPEKKSSFRDRANSTEVCPITLCVCSISFYKENLLNALLSKELLKDCLQLFMHCLFVYKLPKMVPTHLFITKHWQSVVFAYVYTHLAPSQNILI